MKESAFMIIPPINLLLSVLQLSGMIFSSGLLENTPLLLGMRLMSYKWFLPGALFFCIQLIRDNFVRTATFLSSTTPVFLSPDLFTAFRLLVR